MSCLFSCIVWIQNRGFKTIRSKTRHLQSGPEAPVEAENYTPVFMKVSELHDTGLLFRKTTGFICVINLFPIFPYSLSSGPPHEGKTRHREF